MIVRRTLWGFILALLLISGCTGGIENSPSAPPHSPIWEPGAWWRYKLSGPRYERYHLVGDNAYVTLLSVYRVVLKRVQVGGEPFYLVVDMPESNAQTPLVLARLVHSKTLFEVDDPAVVEGGMPVPVVWVDFPLVVGKRWDVMAGEVTARVEAKEPIETPVGTYEAYRIRYDDRTEPKQSRVAWYAPGVKNWVRIKWADGSEQYLVAWGQQDADAALNEVINKVQSMVKVYPQTAFLTLDILDKFHLAPGREIYRRAIEQ